MIVWINGPFGIGKTSVVRELVGLIPESRVHDPERLGWLLKRTVGRFRPRDYPECLDELLSGLRARGDEVLHVMLDAPADVLASRIAGDSHEPAAAAWRRGHIAVYEKARRDLAAIAVTLPAAEADPLQLAQTVAGLVEASR